MAALLPSIARNLDLTQKPYRTGSTVLQTVQTNQFGSPIYINTSNTPVIFNMPTIPYNLYDSFLAFTVTIPAPTGTNYIWTFEDVISEFKQLQLLGPNGERIVDIDNLNIYSKVVIPREMGFEEYMSNDPMNKIYPSNSLANVVPALRNGCSAYPLELGANPAYKNYVEQAHFKVGALNTAVTYNVQLPLRFLKKTYCAVDQFMYYGNITYLKLFTAQLSKVCFMSTSNANPSAAGAGTVAYVPAVVVPAIQPMIINLQLYLATQGNVEERMMLMKQVDTNGIELLIPFVQMFNNSNSGPSQSINIQCDNSIGQVITKIYHSIFSTDAAPELAYDNSNNIPGSGSNQVQKCLQFYTQWNGDKLQTITPDCTSPNFTDYMSQRNSLKCSLLDSLSQFHYSWSWCDDFTGLSADYFHDDENGLYSGKKLDGIPKTWQFVGQSMRGTAGNGATQGTPPVIIVENNNFSHYTFVCSMKKMTIARGQITLV